MDFYVSGLWQCVSIEIELEGYIISNLFSELTITPGYNIADIQHSLSTRPGLRSLKIFVDIERSGIVPGLLPAVFDCRTLHQDLEQLAILISRAGLHTPWKTYTPSKILDG